MQCVLAEPSGTLARHRCVHQPQRARFDGAGSAQVVGCWLPAAGAISVLSRGVGDSLSVRSALHMASVGPGEAQLPQG